MTEEKTTTERAPRVFHPLVLALYPALAFFARNIAELSLNFLFYPMLISVGGAALLWTLIALVTRDKYKSALLTSLFTLIFFSYGILAAQLDFMPHRHKILLTIILGGFIALVFLARRSVRKFYRLTFALNIATLLLVLLPIINNSGGFYLKLSYYFGKVEQPASVPAAPASTTANKEDAPDIYYFIFDRYAAAQTLRDVYNFDNSGFENMLKQNGFVITSRSLSNYPYTPLSLASSLNMRYLDFLSEQKGAKANDYSVVMEMMCNSETLKFVRARGYKYYHVGMNWDPYKINPRADVNINYSVEPERFAMFLETTMLDPVITMLWDKSKRGGKRAYIRHQYEQVMKLASEPGPKFVFSHFGTTHPEFLFGPKGEPVSGEESNQDENQAYRNTVLYHNQRMEEVIKILVEKSAKPPIIILQADEGPYWPTQIKFDIAGGFATADARSLKIRCRIFNAYYLPGRKVTPPDDITPVNTFRFIFNNYFKADMPLLSNESYVPGPPSTPFQFRKVTDIVRYPENK